MLIGDAILIGLTLGVIAGAVAGWQIWTVGPRLERFFSGLTMKDREMWRARFRAWPTVYLGCVCLVLGGWLLDVYTSFSFGSSQVTKVRWTGPNTTTQDLELYFAAALFSLLVLSWIVAPVVYWFNRPRSPGPSKTS